MTVSALLVALHDPDEFVRERAAENLGWMGASNEAVVRALLVALHGTNTFVRRTAAESLGKLEIKDAIQLRRVLVALNGCLHSWDRLVRQTALVSIQQLLDGRPIPGYRWIPLRKRRV